MQKIENHIGYWKFSNKVTVDELEKYAQELAQDERYLSLHIRLAAKDQYALGFEYKPETYSEVESTAFNNDCTDKLKRRFGNDIVGWDISSMYYKVK